jgi:hypothetical protein
MELLLAPITAVEIEGGDDLTLAQGVAIRTADAGAYRDFILESMRTAYGTLMPRTYYEESDWRCTCEVHVRRRGGADAAKLSQLVLTALRLLRPGEYAFLIWIRAEEEGGTYRVLDVGWPPNLLPDLERTRRVLLSGHELLTLPSLYQTLISIDAASRPLISRAILWFDRSYEYYAETDRILAHMVGLEALYLEEHDELAYRLALRCAFLIEANADRRGAIFEVVKAAYNKIRSVHIHGGEPKEKVGTGVGTFGIHDLAVLTEELLRRSISTYLKIARSIPQDAKIRKLLDDHILRGPGSELSHHLRS